MMIQIPKLWQNYQVKNNRPIPWVGMPVYVLSSYATSMGMRFGWHITDESKDEVLIDMYDGLPSEWYLGTYGDRGDKTFVLPGEPDCPEMSEEEYQYLRQQYTPGSWWAAGVAKGPFVQARTAQLSVWPRHIHAHMFLVVPFGIVSHKLFPLTRSLPARGQLELPGTEPLHNVRGKAIPEPA
jgi:hypothetical protein